MQTLAEILIKTVQDTPNRIALYMVGAESDKSMNFQVLLQQSANYAHALEKAGVSEGEVAVIILEHGEDLVHAFFGAILYGAIPSIMPFLTEKLSPERYRQSLRSLIRITRPTAIITYPEFRAEIEGVVEDELAIIDSGQLEHSDSIDVGSLPGLRREPDDVVLLQHSSGTTGLQKGVALSHRAVINQIEAYADAIRMTSDDTVVSWLPLYHDMGLIAGFIMPILLRAPLVLMSPFDWVRAPYKLFQAVTKYKGTLSWLPNFAYNFCAQKIRNRHLEGVDLSSWRSVINCSEPMRWESHQIFLEKFAPYGLQMDALATSYAMAENVFAVTQGGIDHPVQVDKVNLIAIQEQGRAVPFAGQGKSVSMLSAGPPINNTYVRVLDDAREELPQRQIGEIAIKSNCMLAGYFNREDLTQEAFHEGWYLTGDLGYIADGELYVTGRKKELIIVGGKNIYPQDLEEIAAEVAGVHPGRVVAFGVFNQELGTEDVVIVAEADEKELVERQRMASEIRLRINQGSDVALRYVEVVDRTWLIKTSSGKVARNANREKYLAMRAK
jgi:acyl-CoA synthetase (AMP-forming)/AMP-acid ligase II